MTCPADAVVVDTVHSDHHLVGGYLQNPGGIAG